MNNPKLLIKAVAAILIGGVTPAWALDGCKVLLCLAGPWQSIPACASEVEELFRSMGNGDAFPSCAFASGTTYASEIPSVARASNAPATSTWLAQGRPAPDPNCPPQYVTIFYATARPMYGCRYAGMIRTYVDEKISSTTYWSAAGGSVTEPGMPAYLLERAQDP